MAWTGKQSEELLLKAADSGLDMAEEAVLRRELEADPELRHLAMQLLQLANGDETQIIQDSRRAAGLRERILRLAAPRAGARRHVRVRFGWAPSLALAAAVLLMLTLFGQMDNPRVPLRAPAAVESNIEAPEIIGGQVSPAAVNPAALSATAVPLSPTAMPAAGPGAPTASPPGDGLPQIQNRTP
jgi:anti-sigma factor RsiW